MFEPGIGWWSDLARAIFQPDGGPGSFEIEESIRAIAVLEGERPEWSRLKGERRWHSGNVGQAAGGAGNFAFLAIENPIDSGMIIVVEGLVSTGAAVQFSRRRLPDAAYTAAKATDAPVIGSLDLYDYPAVGDPVSAAHQVTGLTIASVLPGTPNGFRLAGTGAGDQVFLDIGWPLAILRPGSYVAAQVAVTNTAPGGWWWGRERPSFKPARGV
jgi:hypothetical protein